MIRPLRPKRFSFSEVLVPALLAVTLVSGACGNRGASPAAGGDTQVAFASMSVDDALGRARAENRLVMVNVYADWCGWCRKLDSETLADRRVAEALKEVISIKVNAEEGGEAVSERYRVRGFPTLLFLSGSGEIVRKVEGYVDADEMLRIVASLRRPA